MTPAISAERVHHGAGVPMSSEISDILLSVSHFALSKGIKFGDNFFVCVVSIKTFCLDVRYPQQTAVREKLQPLKNIGLNPRPQLFSFSNPNTNPYLTVT